MRHLRDYYATHTHPRVTAWLDKNPRVTLHFTPTSCSWLNMVEIFFGIITRQPFRRGTFTDVAELQTAIRTYIDSYNGTRHAVQLDQDRRGATRQNEA